MSVSELKNVKRFIAVFFILLIAGYVLARIASHLISLIQPDRLVPVSGGNVLGAIPLIVFLCSVGIALASRFHIRQAVGWYSFFFTLRLLAAILLSMVFQYDDERAFHYAGIEQVYGIFSFGAGRAYYHLVNILYLIFGENILLPKVVNSFLGSLLPFFAFDIAHWLFGDRKVGWRAFLFTGLLPPFIIFSAVNLKEMATGSLLVLLVWFLTNPKGGGLRRLAGSGICIFVLYWIRGASWTMVGVLGVISYYILTMRLRFSSFVKVGIIVLAGLIVVPALLDQIQQMVWSRTTQEEYFIRRFAESEATVMQFVDVEEPLSIRNLTKLFLRGLFTPSPLRFLMDVEIDTYLEGLNMLVWYILFPMAVIGFLAYRKKGVGIACAIMIIAVIAMASIGVVVGSDPYRHRIVAMGLVATLAAVGFKSDVTRRFRWVIGLWILGIIGFTGLWLMLRIGG